MKKLLFLMVAATVAAAAFAGAETELRPVKYVFLFIGDGMSWPQRRATDEFLKATENKRLFSDTAPCSAATVTRCRHRNPLHEGSPTDSAASGTAIACGKKTYKGHLGLDRHRNKLESVAEVAKRNGRRVGLVTTCGPNHATPAAFYAHAPNRGAYREIARQIPASGFDFFAGCQYHIENNVPNPDAARKELDDFCRAAGYEVLFERAGLAQVRPGVKTILHINVPRTADRWAPDLPTLPELVAKGIDVLDNPTGFFMMVEGSMIDWGCHGNDLYATVQETREFDDAVRVAGDFLNRHPDDTLIVVTGDHETGGLTLLSGTDGPNPAVALLKNQKKSNDIFARNVQKMKADGRRTFAEGKKEITAFYGLVFPEDAAAAADARLVLDAREAKEIELAFIRAIGDKEAEKTFFDNSKDAKAYGEKNPGLAWLCSGALAKRAGYKWTTRGHSSLHQQTSAFGPLAKAFLAPAKLPDPDLKPQPEQRACGFNVPAPTLDNTDIAKRLKLCVAR